MIQAVYIFLTLIISFSLKAETLDINFVAPVEFQQEALEYESIWNENKDQIIEVMES
ncbi:MAG: hypothetical protein KC478_16930 [Bacteriovoracaceae bacterium]|nr:hypothetical protein [Bacteriovoracaceae bacterium]